MLKLDNNQLTGSIPLQIGQLNRIKNFSVSNNRLSGPVPTFGSANIQADSYANNLGLCGGPLAPCPGTVKKPGRDGIIATAAVGGVTFTAIIVLILLVLYYFSRGVVIIKI